MKRLKYVIMVDKKAHPSSAQILETLLFEGMTHELKDAIRAFFLECTPSHNVGSRRYSIWSILSKNLDNPIIRAFENLGCFNIFEQPFTKWLRSKNMAEMSRYLQRAMRIYESTPELSANFDALLGVSYFVLSKTPSKRIRIQSQKLKGSAQLNYRKKVDHLHYPYCELCWRLSQAAERDLDHPENCYATLRFCSEHNPSVPDSMYRRDHRYRARFHIELKNMRLARNPKKLTATQMRVIAYETAHMQKKTTYLEIMKLYREGLKKIEISKRLGISRQAVSNSLKKHLKD
ncbi:hypothetical protein CLU80_2124 [Pseudomonas sp. 29]|jgi:DNA-binding CsgD family transcriptional regulator|uniref:hypothetical protein n=1 Tax=Pseudomonas sp. 29 TaxID=2035197 RepID=UPI000C5EF472|nr:hypothetical protein [Pseudomonas sp. 29]PIF49781.1 hypothetical protein CLU80_2124 [Pseudomonas sp. 29]